MPCLSNYFELARIQIGSNFDNTQNMIDRHQKTLKVGAESTRWIHQECGLLRMDGNVIADISIL
jgi:hypothetical protein